MSRQTPLYDEHVAHEAKLVDFAGWSMPINYGSQIAEHRVVREAVGMFDVSHMRPVDIHGAEARAFLRHVLANDVAKIDEIGRAFYSCMLNTQGGVIDDLIVYHLDENWYRVIVNAGTAENDRAWLHSIGRDFDVTIEEFQDSAIIAVQGPKAADAVTTVFDDRAERIRELAPFRAFAEDSWSIGRTGYTGEDGYEIVMPADQAVATWRALGEAGVEPIGLGARDTLRLEAGLNLYGQDMDENTTPLESGLGWTVAFKPTDRDFIGRNALQMARELDEHKKLVGLVLEGRGVMRHGAAVRRAGDESASADEAAGEITSGSFGPTVQCSIALARVPKDWSEQVDVWLRGQWRPARVVSYPFARNGESRIEHPAA